MGQSTKAIIRKDVSIIEIEKLLKEKYQNVRIEPTNTVDYFVAFFNDGEDSRQMNIFYGDYAIRDYGIDGVILNLGFWGNSRDIMHLFLEVYGGYYDENDCDDVDFMPVNIEMFTSESLSELTKFKHEIIKELGFDKLERAMYLCDKYSKLNL